MPDTDILTCLAASLVAALLLRLASNCMLRAEAAPKPLAVRFGASGTALAALALWWPLHLRPAAGVAAGWIPALVVDCTPLMLAVLACAAVHAWRRSLRPLAAVAFAAAAGVGWILLESLAQGVPGLPPLLPALLALPLVAMLLLALALRGKGRAGSVAQGTAALAVAVTVAFGARHGVAGAFGAGAGLVDWLMVLAPVLLGGLLIESMRRQADNSDLRPSRRRRPSVDGVTGLPLRAQFEARLGQALAEGQAGGRTLAVMQINLDGFRSINDAHGLRVGDLVLEQVARRLLRVAQPGDAVARLSGNDFLLLVAGAGDAQAVARAAIDLVEGVGGTYRIDGIEIAATCSVGVAVWPGIARATRLIACAELAMREARRRGGARHCIYSPALEGSGSPDAVLSQELRNAIATNALELYYQPKIDSHSGKVTAAEALLRWRHTERGMIGPDEFVPLAERNGLIGPLGDWVIEQACRQSRTWRDAGLRMRVAINLSAHQMQQEDLVERIAQALKRHKVHPSLMTCEITETAAMQDTKMAQETFRQLGDIGVHISIDDFGTGYSSLAYLRRLPAEELKIDRAFITDLEHSEDARAVVNAVVRLAHALGLKVVAEGVETSGQQEILVELGCDELQGFLFARPMTARALLMWAMDDRASPKAFRGSLFANTVEAPAMPPSRSRRLAQQGGVAAKDLVQ